MFLFNNFVQAPLSLQNLVSLDILTFSHSSELIVNFAKSSHFSDSSFARATGLPLPPNSSTSTDSTLSSDDEADVTLLSFLLIGPEPFEDYIFKNI